MKGTLLSFAILILLIGCKPEEAVRVVQVPKIEKKYEAQVPPTSGSMAKTLENDILPPKMEAPVNWVPATLDGVRKGSWKITSADGQEPLDVSVTVFPGDVGGILANVNRWRSQLGLQPWDEMILNTHLEEVMIDGLNAKLISLLEEGDRGTLGAILPREGYTWFFKMTGPRNALLQEEVAFRKFLTTVHF